MKNLLAAFLGTLLIVTTAYADKPAQYRFSEEWSTVRSCETFDLSVKWIVDTHLSRFFDKDGVLKTLKIHYRADIEFSRDGFPEKVLYGRRADNQIADFTDGIFRGFVINGGFVKVNLPGYGHLYFEAGRIEVDSDYNVTAMRGANHDHFLGQADALCGYFQ